MLGRGFLGFACLLTGLAGSPARGHEGHDHDKPAPLNLPVAPRVVALTPDFELVGVVSGRGRLTIFLHAFATNEPVKGARLTIAIGQDSAQAEPQGDGVFTVSAPWLATMEAADLVFSLVLSDGSQDLLTGRLQKLSAAATTVAPAVTGWAVMTWARRRPDVVAAGIGGAMVGVLLTMLASGVRARRRSPATNATDSGLPEAPATEVHVHHGGVTPLRSNAGASAAVAALLVFAAAVTSVHAGAGSAGSAELPSVPATMATDLAQRTPDGTLFVPKATQHLLSVRTVLTTRGDASLAVELSGTIIAGPEHFGRVQPGRPGRIDTAPGGLAYIGKRVEKGQLLAYVQTYIEAADRANMDSHDCRDGSADREEPDHPFALREVPRIAVPQVKVDEVRGELDALSRKRAELVPSTGSREPILAPIGGVVSLANATIGQIVEARDVLFEIVDPSQFWVEAQGMATKPPSSRISRRRSRSSPGKEQVPLEFVGRGLALRQQSTVFTFKISGESRWSVDRHARQGCAPVGCPGQRLHPAGIGDRARPDRSADRLGKDGTRALRAADRESRAARWYSRSS